MIYATIVTPYIVQVVDSSCYETQSMGKTFCTLSKPQMLSLLIRRHNQFDCCTSVTKHPLVKREVKSRISRNLDVKFWNANKP